MTRWKERESSKEAWVGRVPNASSIPREALPGGQAEDRLSWSQSHLPKDPLPCWMDMPSRLLCAQSLVRRHLWEMQCLCKRRRACGEQRLGPSVMGALCRSIQAAYFRDCNNPPPSHLTVYCSPQFREQPAISWFPGPFLPEERGQWDT